MPPCLVFAWQFTHCPVRCRIAIESDADGSAPLPKGFAEKRPGRRYIPLRTETEIHGIAVSVHGTVQINPSSAHLQIRLVYTPGSADFACIASPSLFELRHIPLNQRMMVVSQVPVRVLPSSRQDRAG